MRRLALIIVPLLLACDQQPAAPVDPAMVPIAGSIASAAARVDQYVIHGSGEADYDVACTGESMHLAGTFDIYVKDVTLPDGTLQELWINRLEPDWTFVGNTSGDEWDLQYSGYNLVQVVRFDESGLAFAVYHEHLWFENPETGTVLVLDSSLRFVMNAAGEVKVDHADLDSCRLIH